ncbi:MAG: hypothetical protein L0323_10030 [Planctomycetes bacterium]|nr:hypothetical protein [Planctomycetota bacterium]
MGRPKMAGRRTSANLLDRSEEDATREILRGLVEANAELREEALGLGRGALRFHAGAPEAAGERGRGRLAGKRRLGREEGEVLDSLDANRTLDVLEDLLRAHPERRAEAARLARASLGRVSGERVAAELVRALRSLERDDLYSWMDQNNLLLYDSLSDLCRDLLQVEIVPFLAAIERRVAVGLYEDARRVFEGMLLGLYRLRTDVSADVLALTDEFPDVGVDDAVWTWKQAWGKAGREARSPAEFAARRLPEWEDRIERAWTKEEEDESGDAPRKGDGLDPPRRGVDLLRS